VTDDDVGQADINNIYVRCKQTEEGSDSKKGLISGNKVFAVVQRSVWYCAKKFLHPIKATMFVTSFVCKYPQHANPAVGSWQQF